MATKTPAISYIDTTFDDIVNECGISDMNREERNTIASIFNTFRKAAGFDHDWYILRQHENLIALEYFKLFMSVIHGYHAYLMKNMECLNEYPSDIPYQFNMVLTSFCSAAYCMNHQEHSEAAMTALENDLRKIRNTTNAFLRRVYNYIVDCDIPNEPEKEEDPCPIPPHPRRYVPDEDEEESAEEKIKRLGLELRMKLMKVRNRYDDLRMYLNIALTVLVYCGWLCLLVRVFFAITVVETDKYLIDDQRFFSYFAFLFFMHLIVNVRPIYNAFRNMFNDH